MRRTLSAVVALAGAAALVAAVAAAGPVATKQRIAIKVKGGAFVLTPLTSGAVERDTGSASFCCWTSRSVMRNGEAVDVDNPQMTLTGKQGTLVARNQIAFVEIPDGWSVFTGTWRIVRGTGAYAGLSGGGYGAGLMLANSSSKALFKGSIARH